MTLWFKRGDLDHTPPPEDDDALGPNLLPIEDRYLDDGSVTAEDSNLFSLRSGGTRPLSLEALVPEPHVEDHGLLDVLVREMKHGRRRMLAAVGASAAVVCAVLMSFAL